MRSSLSDTLSSPEFEEEMLGLRQSNRGMSRLVAAVQELSLARDLQSIMAIIRRAARELTGADGATFVLREGDLCYYADEDAIEPLWKGQKFPMTTCISGWVMLHGRPAVLEDIYLDPRIPADAYRPTFVRSLAMVPIRPESPIGAIGNYWAKKHKPTTEQLELLQALANTASVALENVRVYNELETRVRQRTAELEIANQELESFSYAVSHDLAAPLRAIRGFAELALSSEDVPLHKSTRQYLETIHRSGDRMAELIDDLMRLGKISKEPLERETVNLSTLATEILSRLAFEAPSRRHQFTIEPNLTVAVDPGLIRVALENLFANAWKYSSKRDKCHIAFGTTSHNGNAAFYIRDDGAGFDMKYSKKLFEPFYRIHHEHEFPGTGIGLATVHRIITRHNGKIWAEAEVDKGATFYFTLGEMQSVQPAYLHHKTGEA